MVLDASASWSTRPNSALSTIDAAAESHSNVGNRDVTSKACTAFDTSFKPAFDSERHRRYRHRNSSLKERLESLILGARGTICEVIFTVSRGQLRSEHGRHCERRSRQIQDHIADCYERLRTDANFQRGCVSGSVLAVVEDGPLRKLTRDFTETR